MEAVTEIPSADMGERQGKSGQNLLTAVQMPGQRQQNNRTEEKMETKKSIFHN